MSQVVVIKWVLSVIVQDVLASQEEMLRRTDAITRFVQKLMISAKDKKVVFLQKL